MQYLSCQAQPHALPGCVFVGQQTSLPWNVRTISGTAWSRLARNAWLALCSRFCLSRRVLFVQCRLHWRALYEVFNPTNPSSLSPTFAGSQPILLRVSWQWTHLKWGRSLCICLMDLVRAVIANCTLCVAVMVLIYLATSVSCLFLLCQFWPVLSAEA